MVRPAQAFDVTTRGPELISLRTPDVAHGLGLRIDGVTDFLELGIRHILSGPDHVLFVVSLLLAFGSLKELAHLTLTFTAAHSVTLLLAGTGVLTLSSAIVEPFIAFSIAFVAVVTVFFPSWGLHISAGNLGAVG